MEYLQHPHTFCKVQDSESQGTGLFPGNHYNVRMNAEDIYQMLFFNNNKKVRGEWQLYFFQNSY